MMELSAPLCLLLPAEWKRLTRCGSFSLSGSLLSPGEPPPAQLAVLPPASFTGFPVADEAATLVATVVTAACTKSNKIDSNQ